MSYPVTRTGSHPVSPEQPVATPVVAKCPSRAVGLPGINLDDDSLAVPDEIALHLLAGDRHPGIDGGCGQPGLASEPKESLLEAALRAIKPQAVDFKCGT